MDRRQHEPSQRRRQRLRRLSPARLHHAYVHLLTQRFRYILLTPQHTQPQFFTYTLLLPNFFFFQVTTQLQYVYDSEPVVDGSRNRWCAVQ